MVAEGQVLWEPTPEVVQASRIHEYTRWLERRIARSFSSYDALWEWSVSDLEGFWASVWDHFEVRASVPYTAVLDGRSMPGAVWFPGARLNYAEHVLRRQGPAPALIAFGEQDDRPTTRSWDELRADVGALAATLRGLGVGPGDRVVGYLPNIPETVVALLAAASLGAVWSCCSPDFGSASVVARFAQIEPRIIIAADGYRYNGRLIDRREVVDQLCRELPTVEHLVTVPSQFPDWRPAGALDWTDCVRDPVELTFEQVPFDHPLWVLYTSGTTGAPKGIVHGHGGIILDLLAGLALHMDVDTDDTCFWFTTTGWVMWNIVVSTMMLGATAVLYDGSPGHPGTDRLWRIAADAGATLFGTGAAYLANCAQQGLTPGEAHDLSRLRALAYTGSPLSPQHYGWVYQAVDPEIWFSSVSGGTDVCGPFVGGNPTLPVRAGEIQCRCLGVNVQAFDPNGQPVVDEVGELVVTDPMPSMPLYLWGDDGSRYRDTYFDTYPGVWRHGDWIRIKPHGGVVIYGRSDATINRHGVRIGSAEIYGAVEGFEGVTDSLVIDLTYRDAPSWMVLFCVLAAGVKLDTELGERLKQRIRTEVSPRHVPDEFVAAPAIPRTLNSKKLEVPVRRILLGTPVSEALNVNSVSNPEAIEFFARLADRWRAEAHPPRPSSREPTVRPKASER